MNILNKIKEEFKEINKISFEKENHNNFLRIEVNYESLKDIAKFSKRVSLFLDENDLEIKNEYILDIFSPGTDKIIKVGEIKDHIEKNLKISLKNKIKNKDFYEGNIININDSSLEIKWNSKGQFLKQKIDFQNIKEIKLLAKAK